MDIQQDKNIVNVKVSQVYEFHFVYYANTRQYGIKYGKSFDDFKMFFDKTPLPWGKNATHEVYINRGLEIEAPDFAARPVFVDPGFRFGDTLGVIIVDQTIPTYKELVDFYAQQKDDIKTVCKINDKNRDMPACMPFRQIGYPAQVNPEKEIVVNKDDFRELYPERTNGVSPRLLEFFKKPMRIIADTNNIIVK